MGKTYKPRGRPKKKSRVSLNSGRKPSSVENASFSTKRRRAQEITSNPRYDVEIIELALNMLRKKQAIIPLNDMSVDIDEDYSRLQKPIQHSNESALALMLELKMSKDVYEELRQDLKARNCNILPSYISSYKPKRECRPDNYNVSEVEVYVPLQSLLEKSSERLVEAVALNWPKIALRDLKLYVTTGFDSSSGHVNPQQKYQNAENENNSPHLSLLVTSMLLIQLKSQSDKKYEFTNPTPQSIRWCRPLRLCLEKEDDATIDAEYSRLQTEIKDLKKHIFSTSNGKKVCISFDVATTLFDGKCVNRLCTNPASIRCPICLRSNFQFGNVNDNFTPANEDHLKYGLSLLHAELHFFEHSMQVSYKKGIKQWTVTQELADDFETRKRYVQDRLYKTLGIRADQLIQGRGTTNTGNLARRCFDNCEKFAAALEIDVLLVKNLALILLAYRCTHELNLDVLEKFSETTYKLYYDLYPWARMSPTVHKVLIHGCDEACTKYIEIQ